MSTVRNRAGQVPEVSPDAVAGLARQVRGAVLEPHEEEYQAHSAPYNLVAAHRPDLIVVPSGADDIQKAVGFAATYGLPVGVQATGHGPAASSSGGLLVSTRKMNAVTIDPLARTAWTEAGAQWHQVIAAAAPHGLAPLNGSSPNVGVVGYTLGGGLGPMARTYGYAADRVNLIEVVTADAQRRVATPVDEPDLFWALRGGKGNFGVVSAMEFGLVPVDRLYGGGLFFPGEFAATALHSWREWTGHVPAEMTSSLALLRLPDAPGIPEPLRNRLTVHIRIAYVGTAADGERLVRPLRDMAPPMMDSVGDMPYTAVGNIHNDPVDPMAYHEDSIMLRELNGAAAERLLTLAGPGADTASAVVEVRQLGGAAARMPDPPNAVGHRDAAFVLATITPTAAFHDGPADGPDDGSDTDGHGGRPESLLDRMAQWGTGLKYVNFLAGPDAAAGVRLAYDTATHARLTSIKSRYDPHNMFRHNLNIHPAGGHD
ncbi:FAD-binding oxidoreductase [Phytoactinopolyspora limicola]|uniref:FAD-binding oxidoreductase n=1 Tax=Phytoactinopolyspora limicola TaxID=2715536 RepID=UPI00140843E4|nr:FAD-binding oxidoreductase [Phytoactinopolyspora limicola]